VCVESVCQVPPSFDSFEPGNVERIYEAECRFDELPVWRFFDWKATTPATNSFIEFWAESASHPDGFSSLPAAPTAVSDGRVVYLGKASGTGSSTWTGNDVGALFDAARLTQYPYLKVTMRFAPNQELTASPLLSDFRMNFSCVPAQ
jgi:hypothetical protein